MTDMTTICTHAQHGALTADIGSHAAKPTALTDGLTEASRTVWAGGPEQRIDTGLWECGVGDFSAERLGYTEICTILSGRVTIEVDGQEDEEFGPGDIMVMPSGWRGIWRVHAPLRKHYTIVQD